MLSLWETKLPNTSLQHFSVNEWSPVDTQHPTRSREIITLFVLDVVSFNWRPYHTTACMNLTDFHSFLIYLFTINLLDTSCVSGTIHSKGDAKVKSSCPQGAHHPVGETDTEKIITLGETSLVTLEWGHGSRILHAHWKSPPHLLPSMGGKREGAPELPPKRLSLSTTIDILPLFISVSIKSLGLSWDSTNTNPHLCKAVTWTHTPIFNSSNPFTVP